MKLKFKPVVRDTRKNNSFGTPRVRKNSTERTRTTERSSPRSSAVEKARPRVGVASGGEKGGGEEEGSCREQTAASQETPQKQETLAGTDAHLYPMPDHLYSRIP